MVWSSFIYGRLPLIYMVPNGNTIGIRTLLSACAFAWPSLVTGSCCEHLPGVTCWSNFTGLLNLWYDIISCGDTKSSCYGYFHFLFGYYHTWVKINRRASGDSKPQRCLHAVEQRQQCARHGWVRNQALRHRAYTGMGQRSESFYFLVMWRKL